MTSFLPYMLGFYIEKQQAYTCCLVESCGQGTVYFLMTDGYVGLRQEAWLQCFTIPLETRTEHPHYGVLSAFFFFCNGCQLACSRYKHKAEGGGTPA